MATAELKYSVKLRKLELSDKEIKDLIESKVEAIARGNKIDQDVREAIEEIAKLLVLRVNKGNKNVDQRQTKSIAHHQEAGTIPDSTTSPQRAASQDETYVSDQKKAYHSEQDILFSLLIDRRAVNGSNQKTKDGTQLTHVEMCNTLDEATEYFLLRCQLSSDSVTSGTDDRKEIRKIYDSCITVVTKRKAVSETFDDNILDEKAYKKWAKHVKMIASFGALAVALKSLVP